MSNSRIHIDQLFSKGLENLEIPISSNSFENIRKDIASDGSESLSDNNQFDNFELEVTDADWQIIKERLAKAIASDPVNQVTSSLQELELAVTENDWNALKSRLATQTRETIIPLPVNDMQASFRDFEIAVTDADWQTTKSKLSDFNKKKMVWWWWLNIAIIGSLIGLALSHFAPLSGSSLAISNPAITTLEANTINKNYAENSNKTGNNSSLKETQPENNITHNNDVAENSSADNAVKASKPATPSFNSYIAEGTKNPAKANISSDRKYKKTTEPLETNKPDDTEIKNKDVKGDEVKTTSELIDTRTNDNSTVKSGNSEVPPTDVAGDVKNTEGNAVKNDAVVKSDEKAPDAPADNKATDTPKKDDPAAKITLPPGGPKPGFKFYAGLVTDVARTDRKLAKSNSERYNDIRNMSDKPFTQFSYGLTAGIQTGKNQFQTGLQMTKQTSTSNYNYIIQVRDSIPLWDTSHTHIIGKFPKPGKPPRDTTINGTSQIIIQKIEIPFTYNRMWKLDAKTQLITGLGGVLSINIKEQGGKMLSPFNNQLYSYSYLKGAEQKLGFSPNINLGVQRSIGNNFVLQASAFGKYSVTNRYRSDFTAKAYPYSRNSSEFKAKEYLYSYGLSIKLLYLLD